MDKNKRISSIPVRCEECKSCKTNGTEFRKLLDLSRSGLLVYIHTNSKTEINKKESIILHNVGERPLKKSDFLVDLRRHRTKCYLCNALIQKVCNLIYDVAEIKENEMIAICEHCKRKAGAETKCNKCDNLLRKFLNNQLSQYEHHQQALKIRLYEVRRILSLIVDRKNICDHKICQAYYDANAELKILLELIKSPLPVKQTFTGEYFNTMPMEKQESCYGIDKDLVLKYIGPVYSSNESLSASTSRSESFCICKYLRDRNVDSLTFPPPARESLPFIPSETLEQEKSKVSVLKDINTNKDEKSPKLSKGKKKTAPKEDKENVPLGNNGKISTERRKNSSKQIRDKMMIQMLKDEKKRKKDKKQDELASMKEKICKIPIIKDLPVIKPVEKKVDVDSEISESIIECGVQEPVVPTEMIHGNEIVPFHHVHKKIFHENEPLFFKVKHDFLYKDKTPTTSVMTISEKTTKLKSKSHILSVDAAYPGIIRYELSNRNFIDKGWTELPTTKIVRKMNIYKMVPACPQFDWFATHDRLTPLRYPHGGRLAEIDDGGCGRWYYTNGRVALEYYNSTEVKSGLKYEVYDSGDSIGPKEKTPKILAAFDHFGNGIVYDTCGNIRLKYNQSEGLVVDKRLGSVGRWKWHNLNDPPVLHQVYVDTFEESDTCFDKVVKHRQADPDVMRAVSDSDMLAIEFENYVKEKALKMRQPYRPFELRMKAVKINDCFSLRIVSQGNIRLLFRSGVSALRVNMGMVLKSNEIVDTRISLSLYVNDVATPFDPTLARSKSVNSI